MMDREKFTEIVTKVVAGWPEDLIKSREDNRIILVCENGTFIKFALMELSEERLNDPTTSQWTKNMMHNKLLIQWTPDLDKPYYKNLGRYITQKKIPENESMREALEELSFRVQIGAVLS